jgi:hypothetical protein
MEATLIQPCRVQDEGAQRCKLLLTGNKTLDVSGTEGTSRISTG